MPAMQLDFLYAKDAAQLIERFIRDGRIPFEELIVDMYGRAVLFDRK
jgi:hypothetical protein